MSSLNCLFLSGYFLTCVSGAKSMTRWSGYNRLQPCLKTRSDKVRLGGSSRRDATVEVLCPIGLIQEISVFPRRHPGEGRGREQLAEPGFHPAPSLRRNDEAMPRRKPRFRLRAMRLKSRALGLIRIRFQTRKNRGGTSCKKFLTEPHLKNF